MNYGYTTVSPAFKALDYRQEDLEFGWFAGLYAPQVLKQSDNFGSSLSFPASKVIPSQVILRGLQDTSCFENTPMKTYYKREDQTRIGYILAESAPPPFKNGEE